jgi:eukaryotic-like serine/threonine-protein kinase
MRRYANHDRTWSTRELVTLSAAWAVVLLASCSRPPAPPAATTRPASPPPIGDFPAFGGGGALNNVAPALGAPPMKVRWTFHAGDGFDAAPIIVGDSVYVADGGGDLTALDLANGQKRWSFHAEGGFEATPAFAGGTVYIGDMMGTFFAIDASSGKKRWSYDAQSAVHAGANIDGDRILFGTDTGLILCLDREGNKLWSAQADGRINAPPAIKNGVATFSSCDSNLRALRLEDGKEVFKTDLGNLAPGSACAGDSAFFVGTDQGYVLAVSDKDGAVRWRFDKISDKAMVAASPALADDTLVVGARDSKVYGLNAADGKLKWTFVTGGDVDASPVISDHRVYVASKDRRLYVLNLGDGKALWQFETARGVSAPAAIGRGVVVMGDAGGTAYCLEPQ